jgi:pyruvate/2-oxoglutarate dehydrogenase complex dihydrolipoamide acyltransferase (E2) component
MLLIPTQLSLVDTQDPGRNFDMRDKLICVVVATLCSAASAGQPAAQSQSTAPAPPAPSVAAAPPAAPSDAQVAPHKWNVERVRCSDLLASADDDRASAVMFYYGYLAAKANIHIIDVSKIADNIGKVMKQCSSTPATTVPQAFRQALGLSK